MSKLYTDVQIEWIINECVMCDSYSKITEKFNREFDTNKSVNALQQLITKKLGIRLVTQEIKKHYSKCEEKWLIENYSTSESYSELTEKFNKVFGRKKTKEQIREKCSKHLGLKGMINATQYGIKPKEQLPIGSIRKTQTRTYIKVLENSKSYITGYAKPYWLPLQVKIYQDAYGEIDSNQMVIFLDGNKENFELNNLYCIDRKISVIMSKNNWWTDNRENTLTAIKWCELHYAMNKKERCKTMAKEQLCWTCQNACGGCSWSCCFQPVEGWTAEKVHRKTYDSYRIEKCPEYVPDKKA